MLAEIVRVFGPGPQFAAWFALQVLAMMLGALLAGRTPLRRAASFPLILACVLLPLVAPVPPFSRAMLAAMGVLGMLKMLQLDFEPRWAAVHPAWHGLMPFDVKDATRVAPGIDAHALWELLLHLAILAVAVLACFHLPGAESPLRLPVRLLVGATLVYAAMEVATEGLRVLHRLAGIAVPEIQRLPLAARTVNEFWSQRWNRPVSGWLGEYVFRPVARRHGRVLALLAAFATSAALHAWIFYAALGWRAALSAGGFFLLQAPVVLLESKLRVSRWPRAAAHAWTLGWLLLTSPLFVEPILRSLGV